ncbi:MAG: transcriptional repressor [candidate division Zixibacteria bacterium CG_4_9_14_3_um_filter_46_8]|nr:MAG: transcriptional repressor [candidate division Zixibacteria bacterium CG_4_9_14_3_um_filter_46_8]
MKPTYQLLNQKIKEEGYRMTRQRAVVLEELAKCYDHPRADEIYQIVRRRLPKISFGTVYRNLKTLKELGLIKELNYGKKFSRFEANIEGHHHFVCLLCGRVYDISIEPAENMCKRIAEDIGFVVEDYRLEFYGFCNAQERKIAQSESQHN